MNAEIRHQSNVVMVRVRDIKVDHSYQRPLDEKRVARIGSDYSPSLAGVVDISERLDGLYVYDGQHRVRGAELAGVEWIPGKLESGLSVSEEAERFVAKNTSTVKPPAFAIFKARLSAGEAVASSIAAICSEAGVSLSSSGTALRSTKAVASLERIYKLGGPVVLAATLRVLGEAFPGDRYGFDAVPLVAVGSFIAVYRSHPYYSEARVAQKLGEKPARWVGQRRQAMLSGSSYALSANSAVDGTGLAVVLEAYNRGLRSQHLPPAGPAELSRAAKGQVIW